MPTRKKTRDELIASGTFRPDRHGKTPPSPGVLKKLPAPPFELDITAKGIWQTTGEAMIHARTLKASDIQTLAAYANELAIYQTHSALAAKGMVVILANGVQAQSPHRKIALDAMKNAIALGDRLGLNPKNRHLMRGIADNEPTVSTDPFAKFLDPLDFLN